MNWKRASIASVVALPIIGVLAFGLTRDPGEIKSPLPGRVAPDFALTVFSEGQGKSVGDTIRLSQFRGEVVVLNFWASWCLQCRYEHTALSSVARLYEGKGVRFFGVLYNDATTNGLQWIQEMGGQTYPSLEDPRSRSAIDYGLYGAPETFFVAKDGTVAHKQIGPVTEAFLIAKLDSLLAQSSSKPAGT